MFQVELKPEFKKQIKDPELFTKGTEKMYSGIFIAMAGVFIMLILMFTHPEDVLKPSFLMVIGLALAGWGLIQRLKAE